jgi:N-sulfoglucosamine sulfohydrolase
MPRNTSLIAVLLLSAMPSLQAAEADADKPNILIILSDDHSAAHLGCNGNPDIKTPNLDAFSASGLRCERAYVTCPQCVPSRASIFTGRSPISIAMTRFSAPLPRDVQTFPEVLRASGWFTGVAGRTYHLDGAKKPPESRAVFEKYGMVTFKDRLDFVNKAGDNAKSLAQFNDFLNSQPRGSPFFLQLCSGDPHRPLTESGPERHDPAALTLPAHYPDTRLVREDLARYYDEVAHLDVFFGEVMAELERRGLAHNTLVIFMGDNGCSQLRGKGTLNEFGIRVPLLIRWPAKIKPGSFSSELISGEDIAPTVLEAAGLVVPPEMTGKSFFALLRGDAHECRDYIFAERGAHGSNLPEGSASFDLGRVVVSPTHKLIYNVTWQLPYQPVDFHDAPFWAELQQSHRDGKLDSRWVSLYFSPTRSMFELYDLQTDPAELNNLAGTPAVEAVEKKLKAALQEWMILERDFVPLPVAP